ncbi:hypothetical protein ACU686_03375 [Yinghuangia aomiensis]
MGRIATWYQSNPKGGFSYNGQLGTANSGRRRHGRQHPVARRNADGRMQVFFRQGGTNPDGALGANGVISDVGVLTQIQVAGAWQPGSASLGGLGGTREIGALSTQVSGRIMLFASELHRRGQRQLADRRERRLRLLDADRLRPVDSPAAAVGLGRHHEPAAHRHGRHPLRGHGRGRSTAFGSWSPVG